ncbi:hypothetical protein [Halobacillus litoralis]|uniref:Uncharacterized protein n=1 Tax=Halobacillus litoralis TaxID=45668 RepID=A0A410M8L1_9BACI|nr:hypothetical protein [Halobacillus litoralis]QAS51036.1 hypothetical protein HLI_01885 [Halobacillus litoralis]
MYVIWVPCYYPVLLHPGYHGYLPQSTYRSERIYPDVDAGMFIQSASEMDQLMDEARTVVERIHSSEEFANEMMGAAQESDQSKVDSLIQSTGVGASFKAEYTPDGLRLHMTSSVNQLNCCKLTLSLRWR